MNNMNVNAKVDEIGMEMGGSTEHYSASYLDTYSSLMDMPQSSDEEDEDQEQEVTTMNDDQYSSNSEPKQQLRPKIIVLSNRPKSSPQETTTNINDDNKQCDDHEDNEDEQEQEQEQRQAQQQEQAQAKQQSDHDDDDDEEHENENQDADEDEEEEKKSRSPTKRQDNFSENDSIIQELRRIEAEFSKKFRDLKTDIKQKTYLLEKRYESLDLRLQTLEQRGIIPDVIASSVAATAPVFTSSRIPTRPRESISSSPSIGTQDPNYMPPVSVPQHKSKDDIKMDVTGTGTGSSGLAPRRQARGRNLCQNMLILVLDLNLHRFLNLKYHRVCILDLL